MIAWCCFLFLVVVQYSSAQVISYGLPNRVTNIANNARELLNGIPMNRGLLNGIGRTMPISTNNMARGNINNFQNLANPYYKNANNLAYANPKTENANLVNIIESKLANDITATALENFASANLMTNIATPDLIVNVPNGATYNFGNSPIPVTVTGRSTGHNPVGINILADNLEVKGLVNIVGRMPIFGAVTLNGNVPSDGMASVNYGCGSPAAV